MTIASRNRKVVLFFFLIAIFAAPWASASGPDEGDARPAASPLDLFDRFWTFLTSVWSETGCRIDPSGRCAPEPRPTDWTDEGCMIDPSGGCRL